ncbi:Serine/arginine repetitive matrix protein [Actinidia chinensis var. chinensis]|uniref:Serine/arginine repetitive matrix protein n=1 Tax=Actinidia chinensis var. chinensis TaxID=1590841 RepID=A0A2R6QCV9_ACTCC|nr:Serine/arginine repetitive matrix protein [Actinidia chinensis var. chinensis]
MSMERSFEAWEEVQRHGHDLADRLAQGFTELIQTQITPPSFPWPNTPKPKLFHVEFPTQSFAKRDFGIATDNSGIDGVSAIFYFGNRLGQAGAEFMGLIQSHITPPSFPWPNSQIPKLFDVDFPTQNFTNKDFGLATEKSEIKGVSAIFDIGNRLGKAGEDFGAYLNGMVQQFFRRLPLPSWQDKSVVASLQNELNNQRTDTDITMREDSRSDGSTDEEMSSSNLNMAGLFGRNQGTINVKSTYNSRTGDVEGSLVARGDLWRMEASRGGSTSGNERSPPFLVQLGPLLFIHDSTLLLPVHLSKQHLLWYGYDRKNGMHSLCPAVWSKHRRWLLMSMICLKPLTCSFVDWQFPNGQFTYVSGEGLSTSAFLPFCGGLLQVQGQYPGEMRFSFACKNKWGTRVTPAVQWPDKSFSLGLAQALDWKSSGLIVRPTTQFCLCPTFGGSNPGLRAELTHSATEKLSLICGCAFSMHHSAFASLSVGRSKYNGNVGTSGIVLRVETPLSNVGRPSFSVQLNSGIQL